MLTLLRARTPTTAQGVRTVTNNAWLRYKIPSGSPNKAILKRVEAEIAKAPKNRKNLLKRVAMTLLEFDRPIRSRDDLREALGKSAPFEQVEPLLQDALVEVAPEERARLVEEFRQLDRVGVGRANLLVDAGVRTLEEARQFIVPSSRSPRTRLAGERVSMPPSISPELAHEVCELFRDAHGSGQFQIHLAGRHRRQQDAREVVLLAVHDHTEPTLYMAASEAQLTRRATARNALSAHIEGPLMDPIRMRGYTYDVSRADARNWVCLFRMPESADETRGERFDALRRRTGTYLLVDVLCAVPDAAGATLLTLTGDDAFLKHLRAAAEKRGLALTRHGLYRRVPPDEPPDDAELAKDTSSRPARNKPLPPEEERVYWRLVPARTERAVFEEIGEAYVPPERRNFSNIFPGQPTKPRSTRRRVTKSPPEESS